MQKKNNAPKYLRPAEPPRRLLEQDLKTAMARPDYQKRSSLLYGIAYQPRRLLGAPSHLLPAKTRRALGTRMVALATSFALLVGMIGTPLNPFWSMNRAQAANTDADYSWLIANTGATAADPYQISSAQALAAVAQLVKNLPTTNSTTQVTIAGTTYTITATGTAPDTKRDPVPPKNVLSPVPTPSVLP
ncbi:MAG: hypothetical protein RR211_03185, partial [Pseudoflavonifractor sp.]